MIDLKYCIQRFLSWLTVLPLSGLIISLLKVKGRYRINGLAEVRSQFLSATHPRRPIIICANHLTLIDSVILLWALASPWRYFIQHRFFAWNLPAVENVGSRLSWQVICYLAKCIPVDRSSRKSAEEVLATTSKLLKKRDLVMLFPEGTRSRSGRFEVSQIAYGIGDILQRVPNCDVLCCYLRGEQQRSYGNFPLRGESFDLRLRLFSPDRQVREGRRGGKELALQVAMELKQLEKEYFAGRIGNRQSFQFEDAEISQRTGHVGLVDSTNLELK